MCLFGGAVRDIILGREPRDFDLVCHLVREHMFHYTDDWSNGAVRRVEKILEDNHAFSLKDLAISGKDLIGIGIPPGKQMGAILDLLLEAVLDDPGVNTQKELLRIAAEIRE